MMSTRVDEFGVITITTSDGDGEAFIIDSPLGVQATTWTINLPWGSWLFHGPRSLVLKDIAKRIAKHETQEDE